MEQPKAIKHSVASMAKLLLMYVSINVVLSNKTFLFVQKKNATAKIPQQMDKRQFLNTYLDCLRQNSKYRSPQGCYFFKNPNIDELSQLEESLLNHVDQNYPFIQFNKDDSKLYSLLKGQSNTKEFNSIHAFNIWHSKKDKSKCQRMSLNLKEGLNNISNTICTSLKPLQKISQTTLYGQLTPDQVVIATQIKIICHLQRRYSDLIHFEYVSEKGEKLTFSMKKYYQICAQTPNTLIVCKTNMDKIIGCFTPLVLDDQNKDNFVADLSEMSFLFSLTDSSIFTLVKSDRAICRQKSKAFINFGGEFVICDKANITQQCVSLVNKSVYICPTYSCNDKNAYLKFNGNQTAKFTLKEWEVWAVQFLIQDLDLQFMSSLDFNI